MQRISLPRLIHFFDLVLPQLTPVQAAWADEGKTLWSCHHATSGTFTLLIISQRRRGCGSSISSLHMMTFIMYASNGRTTHCFCSLIPTWYRRVARTSFKSRPVMSPTSSISKWDSGKGWPSFYITWLGKRSFKQFCSHMNLRWEEERKVIAGSGGELPQLLLSLRGFHLRLPSPFAVGPFIAMILALFGEPHLGLEGKRFEASIWIEDIFYLGDTRSADDLAVFTSMAPERLCLGCGLRVEESFAPLTTGERPKLFTAAYKLLMFVLHDVSAQTSSEEESALRLALDPLIAIKDCHFVAAVTAMVQSLLEGRSDCPISGVFGADGSDSQDHDCHQGECRCSCLC